MQQNSGGPLVTRRSINRQPAHRRCLLTRLAMHTSGLDTWLHPDVSCFYRAVEELALAPSGQGDELRAVAETGRQARLRIWWRKPCGFESHTAHLVARPHDMQVTRCRARLEQDVVLFNARLLFAGVAQG